MIVHLSLSPVFWRFGLKRVPWRVGGFACFLALPLYLSFPLNWAFAFFCTGVYYTP
jgi:hypothetical protein